MQVCLINYLEFWKELLEDNPDLQKLQGLGKVITLNIEEIDKHYKDLTEINSNNLNCLKKQGYFLKNVVNDDIES